MYRRSTVFQFLTQQTLQTYGKASLDFCNQRELEASRMKYFEAYLALCRTGRNDNCGAIQIARARLATL